MNTKTKTQTTVANIAELIARDYRGLHYTLVLESLKVLSTTAFDFDPWALTPTQAVELIDAYNEVVR